MTNLTYVKPTRISLKEHPDFDERWVQERIAEDPTILGLGDLILKDKERLQPKGGRLDLLLQDPNTNRRYEVELQLGPTDATHIIRTIEYWDVERRRYPQYEHAPVLIAEDITSRFLNVVGLFNRAVPIIAIQMNAFQLGESIALLFTTVLDELPLGLIDEDEEVAEVTNRAFWEQHATKERLLQVDRLLDLIRTFEPKVEPRYVKSYIGLTLGNRANNFVVFIPQKSALLVQIRLPQTADIEVLLTASGLDFDYDRQWHQYKLRLRNDDINKNTDLLRNLMGKARNKGLDE